MAHSFIAGEWSPCSVTCGDGSREREVHCKIFLEFSKTIAKLPDKECPGTKPSETEPCFMRPCSLSNKYIYFTHERDSLSGGIWFLFSSLTESGTSLGSANSATNPITSWCWELVNRSRIYGRPLKWSWRAAGAEDLLCRWRNLRHRPLRCRHTVGNHRDSLSAAHLVSEVMDFGSLSLSAPTLLLTRYSLPNWPALPLSVINT